MTNGDHEQAPLTDSICSYLAYLSHYLIRQQGIKFKPNMHHMSIILSIPEQLVRTGYFSS